MVGTFITTVRVSSIHNIVNIIIIVHRAYVITTVHLKEWNKGGRGDSGISLATTTPLSSFIVGTDGGSSCGTHRSVLEKTTILFKIAPQNKMR